MAKTPGLLPPLWICPRCGHALAGRNMSHSCGQFELEPHFAGRPPIVRQLFDGLRAIIEEFGPVTVEPQKTRIVFTVRVRFVAVTVQRSCLKAHLWLTHREEDPRFRIETFSPTVHIHHFKLTDPGQLDGLLRTLLREAYAVGCQEHRT